MIKRTVTITSITTLLFLLICIFMAGNIYAEQDLKLRTDKLDMDKTAAGEANEVIFIKKGCDEYIESVKLSKQGVVIVNDYDEDYIDVTAVGKGDVILNVKGSEGTVIQFPVHVGSKGLRKAMKANTTINPIYYGDPAVRFTTLPGVTVVVKAGKSKNKKVIPLKKKFIDNYQSIKMKKMYNIGTKVRVTIKSNGVTVIYNRKIKRYGGFLDNVGTSGKVFRIALYGVHKGDTIKVRYAGRTYKTKIRKNINNYTIVKIKAKKSIKKNGKVKLEIRNKYKTVLVKRSFKLDNGTWIAPTFS